MPWAKPQVLVTPVADVIHQSGADYVCIIYHNQPPFRMEADFLMQIFKEKRGTFAYRVEIGKNPKTGRRMQQYKGGFRREKDAKAAARQVEEEVRKNRYIPDSHTTFGTFAKEWLQIYGETVKPGSVRIRRHQVGILLMYFDQVPLQMITPKKYEKALLSVFRSYSRNTAEGVHGAARMIFKKARQYGLMLDDPSEFFSPPRKKSEIKSEKEQDIPLYMEKQQLYEFLKAAKDHGMDGDYALFTLLAYTGVRIGESLALTWDDINFREKTIQINKTMYNPANNKEKYELVAPKTQRSKRIIPIDDHTIFVLAAHRMEINALRVHYGDMYHVPEKFPSGFVFPSINHPGYPKTQRLIQLRIDRLSKMISPPLPMRIHPHLFRHTHVSLLAEAGVSLEQIQDRLGHANDDTTRTIYLHITKSMKKEAAEKFAKFMNAVDV